MVFKCSVLSQTNKELKERAKERGIELETLPTGKLLESDDMVKLERLCMVFFFFYFGAYVSKFFFFYVRGLIMFIYYFVLDFYYLGGLKWPGCSGFHRQSLYSQKLCLWNGANGQ